MFEKLSQAMKGNQNARKIKNGLIGVGVGLGTGGFMHQMSKSSKALASQYVKKARGASKLVPAASSALASSQKALARLQAVTIAPMSHPNIFKKYEQAVAKATVNVRKATAEKLKVDTMRANSMRDARIATKQGKFLGKAAIPAGLIAGAIAFKSGPNR